jgi:subtilase family serine protease
MTVRVYLAGRDAAGLAAYATAVATPGSGSYRDYLTSAAERQRFGPTAAQVSAVRSWLTGSGLRVTGVTRQYVAASGPVGAADAAFAVRLANYRTPGGAVAMAPAQNASVPAAVGGAVLTVTGLDTEPAVMKPTLPPPPAAYYTAGPCSRYYGQRRATSKPAAYGTHVPWAICGYTPAQLRGAYGLGDSIATGRGVTVAIVDAYASPTLPGDANKYSEAVGEPAFGQKQYQQLLPSTYDDISECGASGWYQEQTLDVEAVHAMAPGANVLYVGASDCTFGPLLDGLARIVNNRLADVVSDSWIDGEKGLTAPVSAAFSQVFEQGAVEGIGFDFASGDCGYNDPATGCGAADGSTALQANFPASSPWVTAVGGTTLAIGRSGNYKWETAWGDQVVLQHGKRWKPAPPGGYPADYAFGSGGGTSAFYAQPSYQAGVVPRSLSTRLPDGRISARPMREVPDVAMDADPATGFLFGETVRLRGGRYGFQLSRIGGTSLASPLFAGLEADAAQNTGPRSLGFANPLLYSLAGGSGFHDVTDTPLGPGVRIAAARNEWSDSTTGTGPIQSQLYTFGMDGQGAAALRATRGYDDATGIGSPAAPLIGLLGAPGAG